MPATAITRHFASLPDRQIHFRHAGEGPPVVLLHQSPTSSREYEPLIRRLAAAGFSVFAPDTPGYGHSDPMPQGQQVEIADLADNAAMFLDALGLAQAAVYGFHTGGCIANAFARRHPGRATVTVVGGFFCPSDEDRADLLQNYLPPIVPRWDGGHLTWLWHRVREQSIFFPWYRTEDSARLPLPVAGAETLQALTMEFLRAGDWYRSAYGAAFRYLGEHDLPAIECRHYIVSYRTDPLDAHLARLPAVLPENVQIVRTGTKAAAEDEVLEILHRHAQAQKSAVPPAGAVAGRLWSSYVPCGDGQMHLLQSAAGQGRPVLFVHGPQASSAQLRPVATALLGTRPLLLPDLPGRGRSDVAAAAGVEHDAAALLLLLQHASIAEVDLVAIGDGAAVALALLRQAPAAVGRIVLHDAPGFDAAQRAALRAAVPAIVADDWGGHLAQAWTMLRDAGLFAPWFQRVPAAIRPARVEPAVLQQQLIDLFEAGAVGEAAARASLEVPLEQWANAANAGRSDGDGAALARLLAA